MIELKFVANTKPELDALVSSYLGGATHPLAEAAPAKPKAPKAEAAKPAEPAAAPAAAASPTAPDPAAVLADIKVAVTNAVKTNRQAVMDLMAKWKVNIAGGQKVGDVVAPKDLPQFLADVNLIIAGG